MSLAEKIFVIINFKFINMGCENVFPNSKKLTTNYEQIYIRNAKAVNINSMNIVFRRSEFNWNLFLFETFAFFFFIICYEMRALKLLLLKLSLVYNILSET